MDEFASRSISIAGIEVMAETIAKTSAIYIDRIRRNRLDDKFVIMMATSVNGHCLYECISSRFAMDLFTKFDAISMDGQPAVLFSKAWPKKFPERVATTDLIHTVFQDGVSIDAKHFIIGASEDVNSAAVEVLSGLYPSAKITGRRNGYFSDEEIAQIAQEVNAAHADILWICMGVPREQEVALKIAPYLKGVSVIKTGGGVLDFVSGKSPRAPEIIQMAGLEWAFRLAQNPRRLWKRYLISNPVAIRELIRISLANIRSKQV